MSEAPSSSSAAPKSQGKKGGKKEELSPEMAHRLALEDLVKRRFFYISSYEIHGGVKGLYDYGPPGSALMTELINVWRDHFILEESMLQISTASLAPKVVFETSGHCAKFQDYMVRDTVTGDCHRADHLLEDAIEEILKKDDVSEAERARLSAIAARADDFSPEELGEHLSALKVTAPETGNPITAPFPFNLMFATEIGATGKSVGFLRPETAQGMFVNFLRLLDFNAGKLPFSAAQVGPAYRNEIAPRNGLLRVREFTLAEIEHFVDPRDKSHPKFASIRNTVLPLYPRDNQTTNFEILKLSIGEAVDQGLVANETLGYFLVRCYFFLRKVGIDVERIRFRQHLQNEMAHYAVDCWDAEIKSSYGWTECVGNADRAAYDLTVHQDATGRVLKAFVPFPEGPRDVEATAIVPNKQAIGMQFKAQGKQILAALEELDTDAIIALRSELAAQGQVSIAGFTLTPAMISFKTEMKKQAGESIRPSVIEPSYGLGRIMYKILEHAFYIREGDDQARNVLRLAPCIAPIKCAILPLMVKDELTVFVTELERSLLRKHIACRSDLSGVAIGRKYARMDEIGTPFAVTIDYTTVKESTVTLRERDSMEQVRVLISDVSTLLQSLVEGEMTWEDVRNKFPHQQEQQ